MSVLWQDYLSIYKLVVHHEKALLPAVMAPMFACIVVKVEPETNTNKPGRIDHRPYICLDILPPYIVYKYDRVAS